MAVVEKKPEARTASAFDRLSLASLAGVAYVAASFAVVFKAFPAAWELLGGYGGAAAIGLIGVVLLVALIALGIRLIGGADSRPGLRAGIFTGLVMLVLWALLSRWVGGIVEGSTYDGWLSGTSPAFGAILAAMLSAALGWWFLRIFLRPTFEQRMVRFEEAGWFNARTYKPGQGVRVRRGTILGILMMAGSGIWVLLNHGTLERGPDDWRLSVPFTGGQWIEDVGDAVRIGELPEKSSGSLRVVNVGAAGKQLTANSTLDRDAVWKVVEPLAREKKEALDDVIDRLRERAKSLRESIDASRVREKARAAQDFKDLKERAERIKEIDAGKRDPHELSQEHTRLRIWIEELRKFGQELESGEKDDRVFLLQRRIDSWVAAEQDREAERRKEDEAVSKRASLRDEMEWISQWARTDPLPVAARVLDRYTIRDINARLAPERFRVVENEDAFNKKDELPPKLQFKNHQRVETKKEFEEAVAKLKGKSDTQEARQIEADAKQAAPEAKPMKGTSYYANLLLLPGVKYTLPLLFLVASIWLAWRIVNLPSFADFLIATEAEMNKVSWTTRRRLFQDTIVVLVTMVLMAVFLFVVDIAWASILSWKPIGVLQVQDKDKAKVQKNLQDLKW